MVSSAISEACKASFREDDVAYSDKIGSGAYLIDCRVIVIPCLRFPWHFFLESLPSSFMIGARQASLENFRERSKSGRRGEGWQERALELIEARSCNMSAKGRLRFTG